MPLFNPQELRAHLKPSQSVMGIDPGSRQIGLAITDSSLMLASPLLIMKRGKMASNAKELKVLCEKHHVGALLVGLPLSLDGTFGPAARAASDWAHAIAERLEMPAALWDERLSSSAVNRFLIHDADMTRKRRHEVVDKMAAAYTLQGWLDATASSF